MPYPNTDDKNKYISIMVNILRSIKGVVVSPFDTKRFFLISEDVWRSEIVWLNWYENILGYHKAALRILMLLIFKIAKKKIIYTLHNKKPHDKELLKYTNILFRSLFRLSDIIVIHSHLSRSEIPLKYHSKICYLPHPNYINEYGKILKSDTTDKLSLLFLGQVKPYKNVELLVDVFSKFENASYELKIAGNISSQEYAQELINSVNGKNIKLDFKFVHDDEINKYLSDCDLLILPYSLESSLNSGSVILAFSYGKSVICPQIGTIEDMHTKSFLTYSYNSPKEHGEKLTNAIIEAIELKNRNKHIFEEWGKEMYNDVNANNSKSIIKKIIEKQIIITN